MDHTVVRAAAFAGLLLAVALLGGARQSSEVHACGELGPYNFDTYEAEANVVVYNVAIEAAARGGLVNNAWVVNGEVIDLTYTGLQSGPRAARLPENLALGVPPSMLKSIAWIEAKWQNASAAVPWGGVGPTVRSFDCGYGLGQVTTGMENETGIPSAKQALVGTHMMFNLAEAVRILAEKWNDEFRPIAGDGNPALLEDWYFAIWAYNGWASTNHPFWDWDQGFGWLQHPFNPWRDPLRGEVYHCDDPTAPSFRDIGNGDPLLRAADYTYTERIYGCMRYPPRYEPPEEPFVNPPPVTYPPQFASPTPTTEGGVTPTPTDVVDPNATATPTQVVPPPYPPATPTVEATATELPTEDETATATETALVAAAGDEVTPTPDPDPLAWQDPDEEGRIRMWPPVEFVMPDLTIPVVAYAFLPQTFMACYNNEWEDGCPGMDFPTTIEEFGVVPHQDPTPPLASDVMSILFGAPQLTYNGDEQLTITVDDDGFATSSVVSVSNSGTWLAPFRVRTSAPWLIVRHPGDDPERTLHGSLAVGSEIQVITQAAIGEEPFVTTAGYDSVLEITVDPENTPAGTLAQTVWIEPLYGGGEIVQILVIIQHGEVDPDATPMPTSTPVSTPPPNPFPFRAVLPALSASQ